LPIGFLQTLAAFDHGYWYARSAEFMQTPLLDTLRWLRVIGDTLFAIGILGLALFVVGLKTGWSTEGGTSDLPQEGVIRPVRA
jgi:nitric oxide reductase subunit B